MKLKIQYADHAEAIDAEPEGEHFRLTGHSLFMPLAAGDIVSAVDRTITGVVRQAPVFFIEAYFPINTPPEVVVATAQEWSMATTVTQGTALTVLLASESHAWLRDVVEPVVWWVELIRVPGAEPLDFARAVARA